MKSAITLIVVLLALRFVLIGVGDVDADEAYFWLCAQRMDLAFFDGPAGTAALVRAGEGIFGNDPLGLRFAFPVAAAIASLGLAFWVSRFAGPGAVFASVLVLNVIPVFYDAAISVSPIAPALAGVLWAGFFAWRAIERPRDLHWWALAGVALAAGVQFAYAVLLLVPGILIAVIVSVVGRRSRGGAAWVGLGLLMLIVGASLVPAILWNNSNEWAPLAAAGTMQSSLTPRWSAVPAAMAGVVLALSPILPIIFVLLVGLALSRLVRRRVVSPIVYFAAPFVLAAMYLVMLGIASGLVLAVAAALLIPLLAAEERFSLIFRQGAGFAALVAAGFLAASSLAPTWLGQYLPVRSVDRASWGEVATLVAHLQHEWQPDGSKQLFFITKDPASTAALTYHLHRRLPSAEIPEVFLRESQNLATQFGLWPRYDDFVEVDAAPDQFFDELRAENPYFGRSALYLTDEDVLELPQAISGAFAAVSPAAVLTLEEESDSPRVLRLYFCADYQTLPL